MATYAKVRRMLLRDGLSISEIARRTSLSRNTIKAWLREPVRGEMKYRRSAGPKKITDHETWLRQALEADARRPRRERRTALKLHAQLKDQGSPTAPSWSRSSARACTPCPAHGGVEPCVGLMLWPSKHDGQPMAVTHVQIVDTQGRLRVLRRRSWRRF
ncbi:hypothetical protein AAG565_01460 [Fontimonas sp. SYSU GA230001]|uniref:hypothetical protein n=1 Tax=Fontimonas sp. SYSU GA230001 TaxID=3142450 RepID=UPI0032B4050A